MKKMEELRIAFIGVSHWHVPLYLRALKKQNLNIVAVSDPDEEKAQKVADELDCICYTNAEILLEKEQPDFRLSDSVCFQQTIYFRTKNHQGKWQNQNLRQTDRFKGKEKILCTYPCL